MCPVLYFENCMLTHPVVLGDTNGRIILFPSGSQYNISINMFNEVFHENEEYFHGMGVEPQDLRSHS